jgi:hypothetical protein
MCGRAEGNRPIDSSRSLNAARHLSSTDGSPRSKIGTRPCRTVEGSVRRHYGRSERSRPRSKRNETFRAGRQSPRVPLDATKARVVPSRVDARRLFGSPSSRQSAAALTTSGLEQLKPGETDEGAKCTISGELIENVRDGFGTTAAGGELQ